MLQCDNVKLKLKFAIELQAVYLRGTTYLRTLLFGMIPCSTARWQCLLPGMCSKYLRILAPRKISCFTTITNCVDQWEHTFTSTFGKTTPMQPGAGSCFGVLLITAEVVSVNPYAYTTANMFFTYNRRSTTLMISWTLVRQLPMLPSNQLSV